MKNLNFSNYVYETNFSSLLSGGFEPVDGHDREVEQVYAAVAVYVACDDADAGFRSKV